ncbi:MAG: hypothetical protein ACRC9L_02590 [Brevinema sp.]
MKILIIMLLLTTCAKKEQSAIEAMKEQEAVEQVTEQTKASTKAEATEEKLTSEEILAFLKEARNTFPKLEVALIPHTPHDVQYPPELFLLDSQYPNIPEYNANSIDIYYEPISNSYYYARVYATNGFNISIKDAQAEHLFFDYDYNEYDFDLKDKISLQYVGSLSFNKRLYVHKETGGQYIKDLFPIVDEYYSDTWYDEAKGVRIYTNILLTEPVYPVLLPANSDGSDDFAPDTFRVYYTNAQSLTLDIPAKGFFIRVFQPIEALSKTRYGVLLPASF